MALIPIDEALTRIGEALKPVGQEKLSLFDAPSAALGRVLAAPVISRRTHPPADMSAMDGYGVRAADTSTCPVQLRLVGEAPAGGAYDGVVGAGEAVRIFTGGPLPEGADAIVIQENTEAADGRVTIHQTAQAGQHIRLAGLDFREGDEGLPAGHRLTYGSLSLLAAMNVTHVQVYRRPRVAFFATGNELVAPGREPGPHQIIASTGPGLSAFISAHGGQPLDLGIVPDDEAALRAAARAALDAQADMLVTLGGVSVGDHDLVQPALKKEGLSVDFWRLAIRPGKPLIFGSLGPMAMFGLPGNPVSSMVCTHVFLGPALDGLVGQAVRHPPVQWAKAGLPFKANGDRQDYMRAQLVPAADGGVEIYPHERQDSSMLSVLARADCLAIRAPGAPGAPMGAPIPFIPLK